MSVDAHRDCLTFHRRNVLSERCRCHEQAVFLIVYKPAFHQHPGCVTRAHCSEVIHAPKPKRNRRIVYDARYVLRIQLFQCVHKLKKRSLASLSTSDRLSQPRFSYPDKLSRVLRFLWPSAPHFRRRALGRVHESKPLGFLDGNALPDTSEQKRGFLVAFLHGLAAIRRQVNSFLCNELDFGVLSEFEFGCHVSFQRTNTTAFVMKIPNSFVFCSDRTRTVRALPRFAVVATRFVR